MLRSFDYAARHQLLTHPEAMRLREVAREWIRRNSAAFCAGYAEAGGLDPVANEVLLRSLQLDKAVYEVMYEARHRPSWLPIPLESLADFCPSALPAHLPALPASGPPAPGPPQRARGPCERPVQGRRQ
jgi:predicted trehalose synthase